MSDEHVISSYGINKPLTPAETSLARMLAAAERRAEQAERDRDQAIALLRQVRTSMEPVPYGWTGRDVRDHIRNVIDSSRLLDPAQPTREEQDR
jgi:hypothetical protein